MEISVSRMWDNPVRGWCHGLIGVELVGWWGTGTGYGVLAYL